MTMSAMAEPLKSRGRRRGASGPIDDYRCQKGRWHRRHVEERQAAATLRRRCAGGFAVLLAATTMVWATWGG